MESESRSAVRVRRRRSTAHPLSSPLSSTTSDLVLQSREAVSLGKDALSSLSIFPQFVTSRATMEATLRFPAERVQGIVATYLFIAIVVIVALVLIISTVVFPTARAVTIHSPTLAQYDAIASERPACPCSQVESLVNQSMDIRLLHDPLCHGDSMALAAAECARSVQCSGQGLDRTLASLASICAIAETVQARIEQVAASRRMVSPQLMGRAELESLAYATAEGAEADVQSWLNVPFGIVDAVMMLERPVTLEGITGALPASAPVLRTAGLTRLAARRGDVRQWMSFGARPCVVGNASRAECEAAPNCVFRPGQRLQCDSLLCPQNASEAQCNAAPNCMFVTATEDFPSACSDRRCNEYAQGTACDTPLRGAAAPWAYQPQHRHSACQLSTGPSRTACESRAVVCGDFLSEADCAGMAPRRLCHWDAARGVCGYIADWTCPGGLPRTNCSVADAERVSTNDELATYLLLGALDPVNESPAQEQPDLLVFRNPGSLSNPALAPLWRNAVAENCSCWDDFGCSAEVRAPLLPGEPDATWRWSCTQSRTVSSYSIHILSSGIWQTFFGIKTRPLNGTSKFSTFGEAFTSAFLVGSQGTAKFDSYFATCRPATCTYVSTAAPSALEVVSSVLAVIGGLTVIVQNGVVYGVKYLLGPFIEAYVRARPEIYGESPPPPKVSEMLAGIATADAFEEEAEPGGDKPHRGDESGDGDAAGSDGVELIPTAAPRTVMNPLVPRG